VLHPGYACFLPNRLLIALAPAASIGIRSGVNLGSVTSSGGTIMATNAQQLEQFIKESLQAGQKKQDIGKVLERAGWPDAQIQNALGAFADEPFPVAVPMPRPSLSARDAFLYLVMFCTLYYGAWNLVALIFSFINQAFPDPAVTDYYGSWDDRRWATSAVIITFPVFFLMTYYINKEIAHNPFKRLSPVRRWLTYLTIFIATVTLLGDLTTLIYYLLGGGLTTRFVLKVLVVAVVAGSAFAYYLHDLRKEEKQ
jgi:hypothetical protein